MAKKKTVKQEQPKEVPFDFNAYNFKISHDFKLTQKQKDILKVAHDPNTKMIILDGLAGTGKTALTSLIALEKLQSKVVQGVTALRTTVAAKDGEVGFLPGEISSKMEHLSAPFYQKMDELLQPSDKKIVCEKLFDVFPSSFIRSFSFKDECIILCESQLSTEETLFTCATRAGEGSFVILEGDSVHQNDLGKNSGFKKFCKMFDDEVARQNGIYYFQFGVEDIVRSGLVRFLLERRMGLV
jgi:predicted ribonuclease YlaK